MEKKKIKKNNFFIEIFFNFLLKPVINLNLKKIRS